MRFRRSKAGLPALAGAVVFALSILVATDAARAVDVTFTVDAKRDVIPISRYIYGINEYAVGGTAFPNVPFRRVGGNRWTAYNWENNASNAGSDFIFQNDDYLGGGNTPGGAVIAAIKNAASRSAGILLTVPTNGYVAADKKGDGDVRNTPNYLKVRFRQSKPRKGSAFTLPPNTADAYVYQDEFVHWAKTNFPDGAKAGTKTPIWFSLDNEPDLWAETHLEVHPAKATYAEMVQKATDYAKAIKAVMPNSLVFGPANYGWYGMVRLQDAPDAAGRDFQSYYLAQMKKAHAAAGKRLLDALDFHWYPEATGGGVRITAQSTAAAVVAARLQAPRSLFDPTYKENSWITNDWLNGPINLLPRIRSKIANNYPGTRIAITEYNYGAGRHISGGIAQADVLGIFGREGVFAANWFPLREDAETFVQGAFKMYRDFDGQNGSFGDKSIFAATSNIAKSSVYASLDSAHAGRIVLVAINKTSAPINATIKLANAVPMKSAGVYRLTAASPQPQARPAIAINKATQFAYAMPAYSVSTLVLTPAP
jgi:hypothetical protein